MKFIHLSDLHLGKRVNEYSMLEDQEYILKKIINIVDTEKPDGVIIAGDVYDKSVPAAEPEVVDYCYEAVAGILRSANIEYVKWDMNREHTDLYSSFHSHLQHQIFVNIM